MKVFIERINKEKNIEFAGLVSDLLTNLKINSQTVLVVRESELLTDVDVLENDDNIKILSVVSGG